MLAYGLVVLSSYVLSGLPLTYLSVSVEINGTIDLGPNWNYEYKIKTLHKSETSTAPQRKKQPLFSDDITTAPTTEKRHISQHKTTHRKIKHLTVTDLAVTKLVQDHFRASQIFHEPRTVKNDKHINEFALHVYRQSLKVFDVIRKKVDPRVSHKVDYIARSYDQKFRTFVNETLNHKIRTRLGDQKVVLNTIETSNRLMKRLVNYLIGELDKDRLYKNQFAVSNVLQKEIEKETVLEYRHICTKFGICRNAEGFNSFMVDVFTILLKSDDTKIKQASDALTEELKTIDFSHIMNAQTERGFRKVITITERLDSAMTRNALMAMKNMYAFQNHPLKVMVKGLTTVNSTIALFEVIDVLDKTIPPNEENLIEWNAIKKSLVDWQDGKAGDILEIMQHLVSHVNEKGLKKMDRKTRETLKLNLALMFHEKTDNNLRYNDNKNHKESAYYGERLEGATVLNK